MGSAVRRLRAMLPVKLEDEDTGDIAVTRLACKLLDIGSCRCSNYENRRDYVNDCVKLTPADARSLVWLPRRAHTG